MAEPETEPEPEPELEPEPEAEPEFEPETTPEGEVEATVPSTHWASETEILVPPVALALAILLGLLVLSLLTQKYWWRKRCRMGASNTNSGPTPSATCSLTDVLFRSNASRISQNQREFLTQRDLRVIEDIQSFQNTPWALFLLSLPCTISLAVCPASLLLYSPMTSFFWPDEVEQPKVNDVISCFLTPAGLVYAIAFGFAFQEALGKQALVSGKVWSQLTVLEHMVALMASLRMEAFGPQHKKEVIRILKDHTVGWMESIVGRKRFAEDLGAAKDHTGSAMLKLLELLQSVSQEDEKRGVWGMEHVVLERMTQHALQLDAADVQHLHGRIHFLQWAFLETLGYFSFFGILLLRADSYRLELCLCILTVFSIAMFCYVLSDMDSPLHGVFKVDFSPLPAFLLRLQDINNNLAAQQQKTDDRCSRSWRPVSGPPYLTTDLGVVKAAFENVT